MADNVERFGKYVLLEKIATGGMAEVYLAKSTGAGGVTKFVAVKRILPQFSDNQEFIDMFKEEAKIAVNLSHGNVVSIFDFGIERGQFFLVMEYVEGQNMRQVLNFMKKHNALFSIDQIVYMIKEVAAGLDHAHRCLDSQTGRPLNITHRDISPQNIMVSFEGDVKIVDFGIAKAESQLENTRAGTIKGKFGYMSPEQAEGSVNVDLRTDIFSLGIVFWELLANDRLFISNNEINTLRKIRDCQIPSLRKINPNIPAELEKICTKALSKDPMMRYQTAAALNRDLSRFLSTHFPEFATQDFSTFMKGLFVAKITDNRKRFVEFAQPNVGEDSDTNPEHTQTATYTDPKVPSQAQMAYPPPLPTPSAKPNDPNMLDIDPNTKLISDLDSIKNPQVSKSIKIESTITKSFTQHAPRLAPKLEQDAVQASSRRTKNLIAAGVALAVSAAGLWVFLENPKFIQQASQEVASKSAPERPAPVIHPSPTPSIERAATTPLPSMEAKAGKVIHVQSEPSGARIFIDNRDTGLITPGRVTVQDGSPFILTLKADGHFDYTRRFTARYDTSFKATLQRAKTGFIDIAIMNGGNNPVVYVNGVRLSERPPINKYAVPADSPIKIKAENPFAGLSTETVVTVGVDQKKSLNLILRKQGTSPKANR